MVLDLFSRKVVGWSMASHLRASLVEDALCMALARSQPSGDLLHHSDRGSQYTSFGYQSLLSEHQLIPSMSRVAECYDNAVAESFFGTLKSECASDRFASHQQARCAIFEFIEVWYNRLRLHSTLTPYQNTGLFDQFEVLLKNYGQYRKVSTAWLEVTQPSIRWSEMRHLEHVAYHPACQYRT